MVRQHRGPGTATGWQLTDWVEEVVLRPRASSTTTDWISHEVTFSDPRIKAAFDKVGKILFTDGYVFGGNTAIVEHRPDRADGSDVQRRHG